MNPAFADEFSKAKKLLKENKARQAYELLVNKEGYHMGEPDYDLLLAKTALSAGYHHEAIFAYERVLIHIPNNLSARIEMAIAYFKIDELENAQRHLNIVLQANPNSKLREKLDQYARMINKKIESRKSTISASHTFRQGWDSNINSATNEQQIQLTIGTYTPTEGVDKETSDTYSELLNKVSYDHNFNVNSRFFSHIAYSIRENNNKNFDTQSAEIQAGYGHTTSAGKLSYPVSHQSVWLDEQQLRYTTSVGVRLARNDKQDFVNYSAQFGVIRYPDQPSLNMDNIVLSYFFGRHQTQTGINPQYALFYGDETATNSTYDFNARRYVGAQIRLPIRMTDRQYLIPKLLYQRAVHKHQHPFFFTTREDDHLNIALNWNWGLTRQWQISGQVSHSRNDSTVDLYTYDRITTHFGITYKY